MATVVVVVGVVTVVVELVTWVVIVIDVALELLTVVCTVTSMEIWIIMIKIIRKQKQLIFRINIWHCGMIKNCSYFRYCYLLAWKRILL